MATRAAGLPLGIVLLVVAGIAPVSIDADEHPVPVWKVDPHGRIALEVPANEPRMLDLVADEPFQVAHMRTDASTSPHALKGQMLIALYPKGHIAENLGTCEFVWPHWTWTLLPYPDFDTYDKYVNLADDISCSTHAVPIQTAPAADTGAWDRWEDVEHSWRLAMDYLSMNSYHLYVLYPKTGMTTGDYAEWDNRMRLGATSSIETLHHEYGHYVHDIALGDPDLVVGGGAHTGCADGDQDPGIAMSEGWAHFWASLRSTRYGNGCSPAWGEENEWDVFQTLYDMCDDQIDYCDHPDLDTYDWVVDGDALGTSIAALKGDPQKLSDWKSLVAAYKADKPRQFTVAAYENGLDMNMQPKVDSWTAPATSTWYRKIPMTVSVSDPDTLIDQVTFAVKLGLGCTGPVTVENHGASSFSTTYTPSSNLATQSAYVCATPEDELENDGQISLRGPIWIDTANPTASASVSHPALSTSWTVSWSASDSGSGVRYVRIYEQDPGSTTWELIHTSTSASGSKIESREVGDPVGVYCYRANAEDRVGNVESSTVAESCSNVV